MLRRLDRPILERANINSVQRLARYLKIGPDAPGTGLADKVARALAQMDMNNSWPPPLYERRW